MSEVNRLLRSYIRYWYLELIAKLLVEGVCNEMSHRVTDGTLHLLAEDVGLPELIYGTEKKRASNSRKNIALTTKEIESSSSPNKISKSHTSKRETVNEIKIKQEENLDAEEEKLQQPITIIKNDIRFEDLQTFFQKYNLEIPIQTFIRNFESTCDSFNIPEKQKILFIIKLVNGAVKTYIQSQSIPKSFYELKNNLIREFGTQVNPVEIHLQLSKTEKTSKETHIEYFYRVKEIASRINMEEEAEKYYIIRGLKENRAIEIQLQSCSNIEELKEKMKLLDIQEKSKSSKNEVNKKKNEE
ncbi:hypothetical protein TNCV_3166121 [Trichonephila clavipes]|uniref:Retrotransposon gag domain-containing protein n=1 Tax=Trichonephila clavipes TaxID=2585209 RepID=A0A8X6USG1_TRICX|nr:hypothetical protein TNCV_3166121 [Trichonephila clavipes]